MEGNERSRIFMKIKESLDDELHEMKKRQKQIDENKKLLEKDWKTEMNEQARAIQEEEDRQAAEAQHERLIDQTKKEKTRLSQELQEQRQIRAKEVLQELKKKGITKIGREKITDIETKGDELDYESIMSEYQGLQRRETENFEISKKKKMNDSIIKWQY